MSDAFESRFPANPQQAAYWNVDIASKWVDNQVALDRRFQAITDTLVERAAPQRGDRVVDIGCGTGATTLELGRAVGAAGAVLAVDISAPMLEVCRRRVESAGLDHVQLLLADAQTYGFAPDNDLLASRFGVMFFSDPAAAFANLRRALRPGGRLVFACWTELEANPWFRLPLEVAVGQFGPPERRHPRAPGPFAFAEVDYVRSILVGAGYADIRIERLEMPIETDTTLEGEAAFAAHMGPAARLIRERAADPEAAAKAIHDDVANAFRPFETRHGMRFPAVVSMVSATSAFSAQPASALV